MKYHVMDIDEIRRVNMRAIEKEAGTPTAAANLVGMTLAQFSNLRDGAKDSKTGRPRGMRKDTARKIESAAGGFFASGRWVWGGERSENFAFRY